MKDQNDLNEEIKSALKAGDGDKRVALTMLKAEALNEAIAKGKKAEGLNSEEFVSVVKREIRKRKEAREMMARDPEGQEKERRAIRMFTDFIPEQMPDEEIAIMVKAIINSGNTDLKMIMKEAMKQLKGRADGSKVKEIAEKELGV